MTNYSPDQVMRLLWRYHPNLYPAYYINAIAVCFAESGGRTTAISRSGDYGLWQINAASHFGDGTIGWGNWSVDSVQVAEMWKLSSGMTNWAAWCTAWVNPRANCGHGFLGSPEYGSPADTNIDMGQRAYTDVVGAPGSTTGTLPPPPQYADWSFIQQYTARVGPAQLRFLKSVATKIARLR